nr:MAG TPA: hypothetical protein [Caudoviricetes sp.]
MTGISILIRKGVPAPLLGGSGECRQRTGNVLRNSP